MDLKDGEHQQMQPSENREHQLFIFHQTWRVPLQEPTIPNIRQRIPLFQVWMYMNLSGLDVDYTLD